MPYNFVAITDEYISYLRKIEPRVMSNKQNERTYHRKYIGIIEELNGFKYFVPLSSPKQKDYTENGTIRKDSLTTIYIKDKKNLFASLKFNNMIPVPEHEIINFDLNDEGDFKYKLIVYNELYFIRQNSAKIEKTAHNLYNAKKNQKNESEYKQAVLNVTLDFEQLEQLCLNYTHKS
ncbi:type III toxin-antitoxin system ToxN/AbiQ family toxin [Treponema sp.]|uniref:type III toxin-antitoxin system ToxN/AbiQ family toxin n=1 Tax=Treponema sp. TaxID=166 RepID=UPI00298E3C5B|nr:type III toxin-antitoxin system ToxN/AbiQ family toxin [Treponema sp.]MCR5612918.1 type III toxin-antitoxin system ToxN/AbiQ family toxin [Treponema sp.]